MFLFVFEYKRINYLTSKRFFLGFKNLLFSWIYEILIEVIRGWFRLVHPAKILLNRCFMRVQFYY